MIKTLLSVRYSDGGKSYGSLGYQAGMEWLWYLQNGGEYRNFHTFRYK